jgi:ferritin-like metal-binding protein YciE
MPKRVQRVEQLLVEELQDLMDGEKQLVRALPRMAKSAGDDELENAFREHLEVTRRQVQRLEQVFQTMDMRARSRSSKGMQGLVAEGQQIIDQGMEQEIHDAAMAAAGRKVEHYEMAGYESARSLAQQLGMREAAQLLQETLDEEVRTDRHLAQISKRLVKEASERGPEEAGERGQSSPRRTTARAERRGASRSAATGRARGTGRGRTAAARGGRGSSQRRGRAPGGGAAHPLFDHEEIRRWAEERGAHPACVRRTGGEGDIGMIRLDFPGYSGEESLEPISWDDWFRKFDENALALMVQDETSTGEKSNFNKIVSRESAEGKARPRARSAR